MWRYMVFGYGKPTKILLNRQKNVQGKWKSLFRQSKSLERIKNKTKKIKQSKTPVWIIRFEATIVTEFLPSRKSNIKSIKQKQKRNNNIFDVKLLSIRRSVSSKIVSNSDLVCCNYFNNKRTLATFMCCFDVNKRNWNSSKIVDFFADVWQIHFGIEKLLTQDTHTHVCVSVPAT